jgi:uncharacterized membrane protein YkvA (DUF1232 family)
LRRRAGVPNRLARVRRWAAALKGDVTVVWLAARNPQVPGWSKLIAAATAAYALSPIDLIPDFIPVVGQIDDLLIVPLGIWVVLRSIPSELVAQLRHEAEGRRPSSSMAGAAAIGAIWLAGLAGAAFLLRRP